MAFDGIFLHAVTNELKQSLLGGRVEKVYQPTADLIILSFRAFGKNLKLLMSSNASIPRIHLTTDNYENPLKPLMFCTLLRKHLNSAILESIETYGFERVLRLKFSMYDEFGDLKCKYLIIEIMGRHSNIILLNESDKIIESVKRIDGSISSVRQILSGMQYKLPPKANKLSINDFKKIDTDIINNKILLDTFEGFSPLIAKEMVFLSNDNLDSLNENLLHLKSTVNDNSFTPILVFDNEKKVPIEFSFMEISQYGDKIENIKEKSFSALLDRFYTTREKTDNVKKKVSDLHKLLTNVYSRLYRKIELQSEEIAQSHEREIYQLYGDLLTANLYRLDNSDKAVLENYYDNNNEIEIPMDEAITPLQNAQKYFSKYKKSKSTVLNLTEQIKDAKLELEYISTVLDNLLKAENDADIYEIRSELTDSGYIKNKRVKKQKPLSSAPLEFMSSDGIKILVGKNNIQNDKLTLHIANKNDLWFHVKDYAGSHVILFTGGVLPNENTLIQAAEIAVFYSKANSGSNVPVDYTAVKNVKKPSGSKPGMVIYNTYNTVYVTPDKEKIEKLKKYIDKHNNHVV